MAKVSQRARPRPSAEEVVAKLREWEAAGNSPPTDEDLARANGWTANDVYRILFHQRNLVSRDHVTGTYRTLKPLDGDLIVREMTTEEKAIYGDPIGKEELERRKQENYAKKAARLGYGKAVPKDVLQAMDAELRRLEVSAGVTSEPELAPAPETVNQAPVETEVQEEMPQGVKADWASDANLFRLKYSIIARGGDWKAEIAQRYGVTESGAYTKLNTIENRARLGRFEACRDPFTCAACFDTGWKEGKANGEPCECRLGDELAGRVLIDKTLAATENPPVETAPVVAPEPPEEAARMQAEREAADRIQADKIDTAEPGEAHVEPTRAEIARQISVMFEEPEVPVGAKPPVLILVDNTSEGNAVHLSMTDEVPEPGDEWPEVIRVAGVKRVVVWTCLVKAELSDRQLRIMVPRDRAHDYKRAMGAAPEEAAS